jgi:hypothetical protein
LGFFIPIHRRLAPTKKNVVNGQKGGGKSADLQMDDPFNFAFLAAT